MHTLAEDRLEAALDTSRDVTYEGQSYSYNPEFQWGTGDFDDQYPVLALAYQQEAGERTAEQPMTDLLEIDPREGEVEYDFHNGSRVTDEIQCTVAQTTGYDDNGVPAHAMIQQVSMDLWKQLRFRMDLNSVGPNGEPPMTFEVAGPPTGPYRQDDTVRANFVFAANYHIVSTETVESVAEAETTVNSE